MTDTGLLAMKLENSQRQNFFKFANMYNKPQLVKLSKW